ncbi:hypothetical protein ACVNF4_14545, partial [Streptomyces sp. S6]
MDPNTREPEETGEDGRAQRPRPTRDPLAPDFAPHTPTPIRTVDVVAGEHLLTVNPVDGSEIELCPPTERPEPPTPPAHHLPHTAAASWSTDVHLRAGGERG